MLVNAANQSNQYLNASHVYEPTFCLMTNYMFNCLITINNVFCAKNTIDHTNNLDFSQYSLKQTKRVKQIILRFHNQTSKSQAKHQPIGVICTKTSPYINYNL
jgi:hypothetical protein